MRKQTVIPMTEQEKLKYEAATELGLIDRLLEAGVLQKNENAQA